MNCIQKSPCFRHFRTPSFSIIPCQKSLSSSPNFRPYRALFTSSYLPLSPYPAKINTFNHLSQHLSTTLAPRKDTTSPPTPRTTAAQISLEKYHNLSDIYINKLVTLLEDLQETDRPDIDVEYSAGVLTLKFPPHGTYVLNKQPPNKQIWLSSPVSGPKRYDWVVAGGEDGGEDAGFEAWVYLRDGSTLSGLLKEELGVNMGVRAE